MNKIPVILLYVILGLCFSSLFVSADTDKASIDEFATLLFFTMLYFCVKYGIDGFFPYHNRVVGFTLWLAVGKFFDGVSSWRNDVISIAEISWDMLGLFILYCNLKSDYKTINGKK